MTVAGIIFSNIHDSDIPELTEMRTMASVPFGCRYRLIDFPLSNMVNCGVSKIGVITHNNYRSLVDHIGTGKDWDLARRAGGIKILPPFITYYDSNRKRTLYGNRLEALMGIKNFISRCDEENILLCDCDGICNIDLKDVLKYHEKCRAKITVVSTPAESAFGDPILPSDIYEVCSDEDGNVTSYVRMRSRCEGSDISTSIVVIDRSFLLERILEAMNGSPQDIGGLNDFYFDMINSSIGKHTVKKYRYEGIFMRISSLRSYFGASMNLLLPKVRKELFSNSDRPIYTKVRNTPPTLYTDTSHVRSSYIADGCVIEGEVENSILFRGVKIGKGSVVKNSILLQDSFISENVFLNCIISDKNVTVKNGRNLSGHETIPFFLSKGSTV